MGVGMRLGNFYIQLSEEELKKLIKQNKIEMKLKIEVIIPAFSLEN